MNTKTKIRILTWLRRISLSTIFLLLILAPLVQVLRTYRQDPYPYRHSPLVQSQFVRTGIEAIDHQSREILDPIYNFVTGGSYSSSFYGLNFSEPVTITGHFIKSLIRPELLTWPLAITFVLSTVLYLIFGRVFCGYICPMSIITNLNQKIQKKYLKRKRSLYNNHIEKYLVKYKWFYLVGIVLLYTFPLLLQFVLPPALMQHAVSDFILYGGVSLWMILLVTIFLYEMYRPGNFCRHLCPTGVYLSYMGRFKFFRLTHNETECPKGCTTCIETCWLGLNPKTDKINSSACDLCHRCANACPVERIIPVRRKFLVPTLFLACIGLNITIPAQANVWSNKESYHSTMYEQTMFENEKSFDIGEDKYIIFYSIVSIPDDEINNTNIRLLIHISKNKEIFKSPVTINWDINKNKFNIPEYNWPISIGRPSIYITEHNFDFRNKSKVSLTIEKIEKIIELPVIYSHRH